MLNALAKQRHTQHFCLDCRVTLSQMASLFQRAFTRPPRYHLYKNSRSFFTSRPIYNSRPRFLNSLDRVPQDFVFWGIISANGLVFTMWYMSTQRLVRPLPYFLESHPTPHHRNYRATAPLTSGCTTTLPTAGETSAPGECTSPAPQPPPYSPPPPTDGPSPHHASRTRISHISSSTDLPFSSWPNLSSPSSAAATFSSSTWAVRFRSVLPPRYRHPHRRNRSQRRQRHMGQPRQTPRPRLARRKRCVFPVDVNPTNSPHSGHLLCRLLSRLRCPQDDVPALRHHPHPRMGRRRRHIRVRYVLRTQ